METLTNPVELAELLCRIEDLFQMFPDVRIPLQTSGIDTCLQLLWSLAMACCIARLVEHYGVLSVDERELAADVLGMATDAIWFGETELLIVANDDRVEQFRQRADDALEWCEHLLNRVNPKLGRMFHEINGRIDRN